MTVNQRKYRSQEKVVSSVTIDLEGDTNRYYLTVNTDIHEQSTRVPTVLLLLLITRTRTPTRDEAHEAWTYSYVLNGRSKRGAL